MEAKHVAGCALPVDHADEVPNPKAGSKPRTVTKLSGRCLDRHGGVC